MHKHFKEDSEDCCSFGSVSFQWASVLRLFLGKILGFEPESTARLKLLEVSLRGSRRLNIGQVKKVGREEGHYGTMKVQ